MDLRRIVAGCCLGLSLCLIGCSTAWLRWEERPLTYTVKPGDTLYQIAFSEQLDFRELAWWNGIGRDYVIHPGQELRLHPPLPGELRQPPQPPASRPTASASGPVPRPTPSSRPAVATSRPRATPRPPPSQPAAPAIPTRWQWPVQGPILASFAPGQGRKGIDIGGRQGAAIRATAAGKVVYAGSALKGYGQLVIIKHGEEYLSAYGHNARLMVREGQRVKAGEQVATMGLGPQNKPLLHFEIRHMGKPRDPRRLLPSG